MKIRAIYNQILFKFIDRVNIKGQFEEGVSSGGILIQSTVDESAKQPRWARVIAAGPDCSDIIKEPNVEILIDALKWTNGVAFDGEFVWKTDETQLLGYRLIEDQYQ